MSDSFKCQLPNRNGLCIPMSKHLSNESICEILFLHAVTFNNSWHPKQLWLMMFYKPCFSWACVFFLFWLVFSIRWETDWFQSTVDLFVSLPGVKALSGPHVNGAQRVSSSLVRLQAFVMFFFFFFLKGDCTLCDFASTWSVMFVIWLGWHRVLPENDSSWRVKVLQWGTVVPHRNDGWLEVLGWEKPPVVTQPSITRHCLPLLILLPPAPVSLPVLSITVGPQISSALLSTSFSPSPFLLFHFNVSLFLHVFVTSPLLLMASHSPWMSSHNPNSAGTVHARRPKKKKKRKSGIYIRAARPLTLARWNQESETRSCFTSVTLWRLLTVSTSQRTCFISPVSFTCSRCSHLLPHFHFWQEDRARIVFKMVSDSSFRNYILLINATELFVFIWLVAFEDLGKTHLRGLVLRFCWVLPKMNSDVCIVTRQASTPNQWNQLKCTDPCVWSRILNLTCVVGSTGNGETKTERINLQAGKPLALSHNQCFMARLHNSLWSRPIRWIFIEWVPAELFTYPVVCMERHKTQQWVCFYRDFSVHLEFMTMDGFNYATLVS